MAVTEFDGAGGHSYERVRVVRRPLPARRTDGDGGAVVEAATAVTAATADDDPATALCGPPSRRRLCLAVVASNADAFHSSGCRDGPALRAVELSYAMDDYLNVHSRAQVRACCCGLYVLRH